MILYASSGYEHEKAMFPYGGDAPVTQTMEKYFFFILIVEYLQFRVRIPKRISDPTRNSQHGHSHKKQVPVRSEPAFWVIL